MTLPEPTRYTIGEILNISSHRPWGMPHGTWQYYQEWNDVIFLHWQVDRHDLENFVPAGLEIDSFEGQYWVSLVAFTMERIRTRNLIAFPPISNFHEINIRTYVRSGKKTGVYFLSIEGGKRISCSIARNLSQLPYRFSVMKRSPGGYYSHNKRSNDHFNIAYNSGHSPVEKPNLDRWLTERYALYQDDEYAINEFQIHHIEWPLREIELSALTVDYPRFHKLLNGPPDKIHCSPGVQVIAWGKNNKVL